MACRYLTFEDRKNIEALYGANTSLVEIASKLGVHLATIYREIARGSTGELDNNGRSGYSAGIAQKTVQDSFKRRGRKKPTTA